MRGHLARDSYRPPYALRGRREIGPRPAGATYPSDVFRRRSTEQPASTSTAVAAGTSATAGTGAGAGGGELGKGRPTPSRKQAEAARRERVRPAQDRKAVARREREARRANAARVRTAMQTGDETHYVGRDRGPVRAFVRDFVDARRTLAEFLMPILLIVLVLSFLQSTATAALSTLVWGVTMLFVIVDLLVLSRRMRREIRRRFPEETGKGHVFYGVLRATQLRRLRLPKPRVRPGATI